MAEPFARTTRYLEADSGRLALAGAVLGLIAAVLWLAWLFLARVPLYERTSAVRSAPDGTYIVMIDPVLAADLQPGQQAFVRSLTPTDAMLPATVVAVDPDAGVVQIELAAEAGAEEPPAGAEVWMVLAEVSPATLIVQAVEQTFTTP